MKKKSNNIFIKLIKSVAHFFDKILILPIAKLIVRYKESRRGSTNRFEKLINNKQVLIIMSLLLAVAMFFMIDRKSVTLLDKSAEVLYGQKVTAIYNEEEYVIEGLPETVDITLIGRKSDVYLAKQYPAQEVSVDLRGLGVGTHTVKLKYSQDVSSVEYKMDPSTATVVISEKVSSSRTLSYDILHQDNLNSKLQIDDVKLSRSDVIIKGSEERLKQVASVKALIDIDNISNPTVGETTLEHVKLVAYDKDGKIVQVEVVPNDVTATITIASPCKEVPIKVIPEGKVALGKGIDTMESSVNKVVIYGKQSVLDKIDSIPVTINVTGLSVNKDFNVNIDKPSGIRDLSIKTAIVKVTVADASESKTVNDIYIETKNLSSSYKVQAFSKNDSKISVVVKGTKRVLDSLDVSTISAYIDLKDKGVGEYEVDVVVTGNDLRATYTPKVSKVKIKISEK